MNPPDIQARYSHTHYFNTSLVFYVPTHNASGEKDHSIVRRIAKAFAEQYGGTTIRKGRAFWLAGDEVKDEDIFFLKIFTNPQTPTSTDALGFFREICTEVKLEYISYERNGMLKTERLQYDKPS